MTEGLLTVLKFCFLALVYLFLLRVVRVTVLELRTPVNATRGTPTPAAATAEKPQRGRWRLEFVEPTPRRGEVVVLGDDVTVGRGGGCGIALPDDTFVSQVHARIYQRDGKLWLEDLDSTNGTYHNGQRVTGTVRLKRGDQVQVGQTVAQVAR